MQDIPILEIDMPSVEEFRKGLPPLIDSHLEWLKEGSKFHNLTRVPEEDWFVRHVLDSLVPFLAGWDIGDSFVDIGTGPGFPGVPLGLQFEKARFTLIESKKKVARFLHSFLEQHGIPPRGTVQPQRIEDLAHDPEHREKYDRVVTRALSSLPVLVELGIPYLKQKGELWCWKTKISELNEVGVALKQLHCGVSKILRYRLPGETTSRHLFVIEKYRVTSPNYPRKAGIPQKRPLV